MHYPLLALVPTEEITDANSAYSAVARRVAYFDMEREVDPYEVPCLCLDPSPQGACEECEGTGLMEVTYPPDSRFDYFGIGGRWSGMFDATGAGRDVLPAAELVLDTLPAVVTAPDGTWFADADFDDGSENSAEPEAPRTVNVPGVEWGACVAELVRDHQDCTVIVADMHA